MALFYVGIVGFVLDRLIAALCSSSPSATISWHLGQLGEIS